MEQILKSDSPSFNLIRNQPNGEAITQAMISKLLIDFITFLNIGKTMGEAQIVETVKLIIEDYSALKPDDFVLFFSKAKRGYYGKVYDRMDGQILFEWLEQFMFERDTDIERIRKNEKIKLEKELLSVSEAVEMPEYFKPLLEKKVITDTNRPLVQTEQQQRINRWVKEFDDLWLKQGSKDGKRFVSLGDQWIDVGEWLLWKQKCMDEENAEMGLT